MPDTPITDLHGFGLTFHQTGPLERAGITSVEQLVELVDNHDEDPDGSQLAAVPGFGPARIQKVRAAIHAWKATVTSTEEGATATTNSAPIACLCGSTRFMAEMAEANRRLTAEGHIVLAPGCDLKQPHPLWDTEAKVAALKPRLDALHRAKIALADEVVVVSDHTRYIGDSTRAEIAHAELLGKPWRWWTPALEPTR